MSVKQENHVLTLARKAQLICETAPVSRFVESTDLTPYLERFYQLVRNKALEDAKQAAIDCVAFNGGTVQTESHIRQRIDDMKDLT